MKLVAKHYVKTADGTVTPGEVFDGDKLSENELLRLVRLEAVEVLQPLPFVDEGTGEEITEAPGGEPADEEPEEEEEADEEVERNIDASENIVTKPKKAAPKKKTGGKAK
jgi:hypothetical protein